LIITKGGKYSFQVPTHEIKAGRAGSMRFFYQSKLEPNNGSGQRGVPFNHLVIPEGDANPLRNAHSVCHPRKGDQQGIRGFSSGNFAGIYFDVHRAARSIDAMAEAFRLIYFT
jgi:hypothetical protein